MEAVLAVDKHPSEIVRDFERRDLHVPIANGLKLVSRLREQTPTTFAGHKVTNIATLDGTKLIFEDESWILLWQSGTEPVLRVYYRATSVQKMTKLMNEGEMLAH